MENINKYWIILESLNFPVVGVSKVGSLNNEERIKINITELEKHIKLTPQEIIKYLINEQSRIKYLELQQHILTDNLDDSFVYGLYLLKILLKIYKNVNFASDAKEDLISERHKSLVISGVIDVAQIVLQGNLHSSFYKDKGGAFNKTCKNKSNMWQLEFVIEVFTPLIFIKQIRVGKCLDDAQLWYMAAIFSLLIANDNKEYEMDIEDIGNLQAKLQKLWLDLPKSLYYRNLMLLYSTLPKAQKQRIHKEMLLRLWSKGGFMALLFAMIDSQRSEEQSLDEIIANIVCQPAYSVKAQQSLLEQILQFLRVSLKNKELSPYMGAGILSLRKLYDNKQENKIYLKDWLKKEMQHLVEADETMVIAMEWHEFIELISLLFHVFCTSSVAALPSDLLVPYLPVFLELYRQMQCYLNQESLSDHLRSLIVKIINNQSKDDLKRIIEGVALRKYPKEWSQVHYKIRIVENCLNMQELKLSLMELETSNILVGNFNHLNCLIAVLKSSSHNLLTYEIFLILLQLVPLLITKEANSNATNVDLVTSDDDIYNRILLEISSNYEHKFVIIKSLEALVHHQPLKAILNDNILELLKALQNILTAYCTTSKNVNDITDYNSAVLMILLILIREIIENCSVDSHALQRTLLKPLKQLLVEVKSENLSYQINFLIKLIEDEELLLNSHYNSDKDQFADARKLIESPESYLQVEGIEKAIKLINNRDAFTIANSHVLTALALNTLRSPESYTFLNCVRLFMALVNINESEVLELLSDEYLNDSANMDYRLVIGEAVLKTSKEIGPLCYKYKNVLLNTFMAGCHSPLDEFRLSAFSNLSQMCRLLTYQVHNYFQELLNLIDCEISTGKYLPAKRAAVMVLSDLLAGMDNLFDYEEMLLPIYRILKHLAGSETSDEKIRMHALNGLKCLSEKCKELFKKALESGALEKEIKIMGIHDKPKGSLKNHILEMN